MLLGLDIGTTKVAAVIVDSSGALAAVAAADHGAGLVAPAGRAEQDAQVLLEAAWRAVRQLPADARHQVRAIGLTGQMHGVVQLNGAGRPVSPLITWQDRRCLEDEFLERLAARAGCPLRCGFGCATLAWLVSHSALSPDTVAAATIQDCAAMMLCGAPRPVTDPTDAASWGLFDLRALAWNHAAARAAELEPALLPEVRPCGSRAGSVSDLMAGQLGLTPGIPVAVALGDNQASLLATLSDPLHEMAITLGTGAQASAVLPHNEVPHDPAPGQSYEFRPYPGRRYMITTAALCGGSAWAWLARTVVSWQRDLGLPVVSENVLYARLNALGLAASDGPVVAPHFLGERHAPAVRGAITGIGLDNFQLGQLARGLARGILTNLRDMLGPQALERRVRLVGSGNVLRRNPLFIAVAEEVFGLPLVMSRECEEAARGAALNAAPLAHAPRAGEGHSG